MIVVYTLPILEVRAIGRKLAGFDGSSLALVFMMSVIEACFHVDGTVDVSHHRLYRSSRCLEREGHLFRTLCEMASYGLGLDDAFDRLITAMTSSILIGSESN